MTDAIVEKETRQAPSEPGDHDRFSHYIRKDLIVKSMVEGVPVKALCGKVLVVTRDGMRFPRCPECDKKWEEMEE